MNIDWEKIFVPSQSVTEIIVRGMSIYFGLLILFRVLLKRQSSDMASSDMLLVVLIADAVQNGMAGEYHSVTEALILGATLMFCGYFADWLEARSKFFERLISEPPTPIIRNGILLRKNMRKELLTEGELMAQLRQGGVEHVKDVKAAFVEGDGKISVIKYPQ